MHKQFAVIGLGYFGRTIAIELARNGHDVLGIDIDQRIVNQVADSLTEALIADATDEQVLDELGLDRYDAVIIAIGESIEASVLCTLFVKNLGAKELWVKAINEHHHKILAKLGADRIILPEYEMGLRVAQSLSYRAVLDYISLGHDYFVVEVEVTENGDAQPIESLGIDDEHPVRLLALKRHQELLPTTDPNLPMARGDRLVLLGKLDDLRVLSPRL